MHILCGCRIHMIPSNHKSTGLVFKTNLNDLFQFKNCATYTPLILSINYLGYIFIQATFNQTCLSLSSSYSRVMKLRNKQFVFRKGNTYWLNNYQKKELDHGSSVETSVPIPSEITFHVISLYFLSWLSKVTLYPHIPTPLPTATLSPNFSILGKKSQDPFILPQQPFLKKEIHFGFFTIGGAALCYRRALESRTAFNLLW